MPLQLRKNPECDFSLPQVICNFCGHRQTIFVSSHCSCAKCHRFFHVNAFKISNDITDRFKYYQGDVVYETGT